MAKRTLTGTYADGYTLEPRFSKLLIKDTAVVEGYGLVVSAAASVSNRGTIIVSQGFTGYNGVGDYGVMLRDGGQILNGGTIVAGVGYSSRNFTGNGGVGIQLAAAGNVVNTGFIAGGHGGGSGFKGYAFGGVGGAGLSLADGGTVFNKAGTIVGGVGGLGGAPLYGRSAPSGDGGAGVAAAGYVEITNDAVTEGGAGGVGDETSGANGGAGVALGSGSIANSGTVWGGAGGAGDLYGYGGYGGNGVAASASVILANTGEVFGGVGGKGATAGDSRGAYGGGGGAGIYLAAAGSISNSRGKIGGGAGGIGGNGYEVFGAGGRGGTGGAGVVLKVGGSLENLQGDVTGGAGGAGGYGYRDGGGDGGRGGDGVDLLAGGTVANLGTIAGGTGGMGGPAGAGGGASGAAGASGDGIVLTGGGTVVNGSHKSLIEGATGILASGSAATTVINYGTIDGTGVADPTTGVAVQFTSAADRLVARAQSDFIGLVEGGGATLELTGGMGSIAGIGGVGVASGSLAITFTKFAAYVLDGADAWTMTGTNILASGKSLTDAGSLTISGTLVNAGTVIAAEGGTLTVGTALANSGTLAAEGTLIVEKAVTGAGVAEINGGTLDFLSTFDEAVDFLGLGTLALSHSQGYLGQITGFSASGGADLDLGDIRFVGAGEATFSGTTSGGVLTVTGGTHTANINLVGDYLDATFVASSDGAGGTDVVAQSAQTPSPAHFASAMAAIIGHGVAAGLIDARAVTEGRQMMLAAPRLAIS
jgi:autotransporter family porin